MMRWSCAAGMAILFTACGGGGGGSGGEGGTSPPVQPVGPALLFSPDKLTTTVEAGLSATVSVNATVVRPADFTGNVYALVVDNSGVILPNPRLLANSSTSYTATVQTSPSLAPGVYKGSFTVELCRDTACASQYPGSPMSLPYEFTVTAPKPAALTASPTTLAATMNLGGAPPHQLSITIGGASLQWSAASNAGWIKLSKSSGTGISSLGVDVDPTGLKEGKYDGEITLTSTDGQTVRVPVSLTMLANAFQTSASGYTFNAINGAPIGSQDITIALSNQASGPWSAATDSTWLSVNPGTGTTPGQATLSVDPARGKLASGSYSAKLTLSSPYAKDGAVPVQLNLTKATLSSSVPAVTLGGAYGRDFPSVPLTLSLNTKGNAWPWQLAGVPVWARFNATSGSINESGTALTVTPNYTAAPVGSTTVALAPQAAVNGDTVAAGVSLTINRDQQKILPSVAGVAFVQTPGWSSLTRTVTVSDNYGLGTGWSAASDQGWLTVARSGNSLSLQANPASLPLDAISYATVTLTPAITGVTVPETIRVALWNGSAAPAPMTRLALTYTNLVADPIRPLVYAHNGGGSIDVYNVYTAQKKATVPLASALGDMAVAPDGGHLYAYDTANRSVNVLDLATLAKSATWALTNAVSGADRILSIRPNGVEIVLTSSGAYRASDGKLLAAAGFLAPGLFGTASIAATPDGKHIYTQDTGYSPSSAGALSFDYSEMGGGTVFSARTGGGSGGSNGGDIAVNADGSRVYTANGAPYRCEIFDAGMKPFGELPGGDAYPNNVEVDSDGRVYCGINGIYSTYDVWMHDANGALLKSFKLVGYAHGLLRRQMVVSGDARMMVALTDDPALVIVAVGP
jgi:hypothetical protein